MHSQPEAPFDPTLLRVGADLRRLGIEPSREEWVCVRRGVWVSKAVWSSWGPDRRHQALTHATLMSTRAPDQLVLAAHSAAAIWDLPRIETWPGHVVVLDSERRMGPSRYVRPRHGDPVAAVQHDGVLVTPIARTIIDLTCTGTLDTALVAADNALSRELCTREDLLKEYLALRPGARGRGKARLIIDLADPRSGSAGESVSRLQMFRANFPRPVLQQEYRDSAGRMLTDFDWEHLIGEFDGRQKYRVPAGATAQEAGDIVWREKRREDRLRRFKPVARWVWATARSTDALAKELISHGLRPERRSTWIDLGSR